MNEHGSNWGQEGEYSKDFSINIGSQRRLGRKSSWIDEIQERQPCSWRIDSKCNEI